MTHPPIPPKSNYFYEIVRTGAHVVLPLAEDGRCFQIRVADAGAFKRTVIAAVAEVEWRKRCDRWGRLADLCLNGSMRVIPHRAARRDAYVQKWIEAEEHADAWRTWGEGK